MTTKTSFQIRVSEEMIERLDKLQELIKVNSKAEVIRDAISYFDLIINEVKRGNEIFAIPASDVPQIQKGVKIAFPPTYNLKQDTQICEKCQLTNKN